MVGGSGSNNAGPDKEKFQNGTEAVPKNIYIRNNYFLENCYFFPGCSPIATYFTQNMWIEHNFIYKCSYSAMSIGWGWCNFDGEVGSDSQLPGLPTTTSRNNHVNYNRIEDYASILQDCGGIYTLGQQATAPPAARIILNIPNLMETTSTFTARLPTGSTRVAGSTASILTREAPISCLTATLSLILSATFTR